MFKGGNLIVLGFTLLRSIAGFPSRMMTLCGRGLGSGLKLVKSVRVCRGPDLRNSIMSKYQIPSLARLTQLADLCEISE